MIVPYIVVLGLAILILASSAQAMKPAWEYGDNQCELIAKDYQREYYGSLVWIQPMTSNGAWEFGEYAAHMLNRAYTKERGIYYVDYYTNTYFNNTKEIHDWYKEMTGKENYVFDFMVERPGWGITWHY